MQTHLITGATGFLGRALCERFRSEGAVVPQALRSQPEGGVQADLRDPAEVKRLLGNICPDVLIHAAAYREPDFCEQQPDEARRLNLDCVGVLADCLAAEARLVFISTDYVFDGERGGYREEDAAEPVNVYGHLKRQAEQRVLARPGSLVVRIPVLVGPDPTGFVAQMAEAARSGTPQVVDHVLMRYPTLTADVAENLAWLLRQNAVGIWHISSTDGGTRYALNCRVAETLGVRSEHLKPSTDVIPRSARRPLNSRLLPDKLLAEGGPGCRDFAAILRELL